MAAKKIFFKFDNTYAGLIKKKFRAEKHGEKKTQKNFLSKKKILLLKASHDIEVSEKLHGHMQ